MLTAHCYGVDDGLVSWVRCRLLERTAEASRVGLEIQRWLLILLWVSVGNKYPSNDDEE